jgi:flagellar biosynthesis/type III secretory pathway chaperone
MSADANPHLACAESLLALLEQERQALHGADFDRLLRICREKAQALQQLGSLLTALRGAPVEAVLPGLRQQLRELIVRCQQQTRANDALLQVRARRSRGALRVLRGAPEQYDGRGRYRYPVRGILRGSA